MTSEIFKVFGKPYIPDGRQNLSPKLHIICWTLVSSYNTHNYLLFPNCFTLERIACLTCASMCGSENSELDEPPIISVHTTL